MNIWNVDVARAGGKPTRRDNDWKKSAYRRVAARDGDKCSQCDIVNQPFINPRGELQKSLHLDHARPLCEGGSNHDDNLQLLCEWCHKQKTGWEKRRRSEQRWLDSGLAGYAQVLL